MDTKTLVTPKPFRTETTGTISTPALPPGTTQRTLAVIMGGGAGTRLFPLTKDRSKPAVPLGGKYRLVDVPISNCLNSGLRSIYILTQFNSMPRALVVQNGEKTLSRSSAEIPLPLSLIVTMTPLA